MAVATTEKRSDVVVDERNREFVNASIAMVDNWLQNSTEKSLIVTAENSFKRLLIHQEVRKRYNSFLMTEKDFLGVKVTRLSADERENGFDAMKKKEIDLDDAIGFRKVIDAISESRKPVIGHNMFLDLAQTYDKFIGRLPDRVQDFKAAIHALFPILYDSKYIAHSEHQVQTLIGNNNSTALEALSKSLMHPDHIHTPSIVLHPDTAALYTYSTTSTVPTTLNASSSNTKTTTTDSTTTPQLTEKYHDAGYDAYCTGLSFLRMMARVCNVPRGGRIPIPTVEDSGESKMDHELERCVNKLYLMKSDVVCMDLTGEDEVPDRSNALYISEIPKDMKTYNIRDTLAAALSDMYTLNIRWITETSCMIIISHKPLPTEPSANGITSETTSSIDMIHADQIAKMVKLAGVPFHVQSFMSYQEGRGAGGGTGTIGEVVVPGLKRRRVLENDQEAATFTITAVPSQLNYD